MRLNRKQTSAAPPSGTTAKVVPLDRGVIQPVKRPAKAELETVTAQKTTQTRAPPSAAELRTQVDAQLKVDDAASIVAKRPELSNLATAMWKADLAELFGDSAQTLMERFAMASDPVGAAAPKSSAMDRRGVQRAFEIAPTLLQELAHRTLDPIVENTPDALKFQRLSPTRRAGVIGQHAGYVAGTLAADPKLGVSREGARLALISYMNGTLAPTKGGTESRSSREILAEELSLLSENPQAVIAYVLDPENDGMFAPQAWDSASAVALNLASIHAGEATLEFASQLVGKDRAAAFVNHVFSRPEGEVLQLMRVPVGIEGMLVHFAATADHLAWQWAKLGNATLDAQAGNATGAIQQWQHRDMVSSRTVMTGRPDAAGKLSTQVETFLIGNGDLLAIDRSGSRRIPLFHLLRTIAERGIYSDPKLRLLSPEALEIQDRLAEQVIGASGLKVWQVAAGLGANVVANISGAFASNAAQADFAMQDRIVRTIHGAVTPMLNEVIEMLKDGAPQKTDDDYRALYQARSGEASFRALESLLKTKARGLARDAAFANLIPMALKNLQLPMESDYTAQNLVADLIDLKRTLLAKDFYLTQDGFPEELAEEAKRSAGKLESADLEVAIRLPNATWMFLLLIRGLVEDRLDRLKGAQRADLNSDTFPDSVQFNPADVRDVELFNWARHRLITAHGMSAAEATRKAVAVVVFTLYKDLIQLRKGAAA